jgi:hypothetical protein
MSVKLLQCGAKGSGMHSDVGEPVNIAAEQNN